MQVRIRENSLIAKFAANILREATVAIVIGRTIYLWNTSKTDFLKNKKWVQHELVHIRQFRKYGLTWFIILCLAESIRKGYYNNRFEEKARHHENNENFSGDYQFS